MPSNLSIFKRLLLPIFLGALAVSCTTIDGVQSGDNSQYTSLSVNLDIADYQGVKGALTRSAQSEIDAITSLSALVFGANGAFLSRHSASALNLSEGLFQLDLESTHEGRIIHFVANYTWDNFDDEANIGRSEAEVVTALNSSSTTFWQRMESTSLDSEQLDITLSMVANVAYFSLENLAGTTFTSANFALYNCATMGSVAPYDVDNEAFTRVTTEVGGDPMNGEMSMGNTPFFTFERVNNDDENAPYIILSGTYNRSVNYYKIAICNSDNEPLDIARHSSYNVVVQSVTARGYSSLESAQQGQFSNNIEAYLVMESCEIISDGTNILNVESTSYTFTEGGDFSCVVTCSDMSGVVDNSQITIELSDNNVITGTLVYDPSTSLLTGVVTAPPTDGLVLTSTIYITSGELARAVTLQLRQPFDFQTFTTSIQSVPNEIGTQLSVTFTIPEEAAQLLPLDCYFTSAHLTPTDNTLSVNYIDGRYQYLYRATAVGEQQIDVATNSANAGEVLYLEADNFATKTCSYTNESGVLSLSNVYFSPHRVNFGVGESVTLHFNAPTSGFFVIQTNNLQAVSSYGTTGLYFYYTSSAGVQSVEFTTTSESIYESVTITASGYNTTSVELRNELVNISGSVYRNNSNATAVTSSLLYLYINSEITAMLYSDESANFTTAIDASIGDTLYLVTYINSRAYYDSIVITSPSMVFDAEVSRYR